MGVLIFETHALNYEAEVNGISINTYSLYIKLTIDY